MTWFAFKGYNGGKAIDVAGIQEKNLVAWGFHGYGTEPKAEANPNSVNLAQKVIVDSAVLDYNSSKPAGGGVGSFGNVPGNAAGAAAGALAHSFSFNLGPLGKVTDPAMWRSLGWLLLGFMLMTLGIYLWLRNSGIAPMVAPVPV